MIWHAFVMQNDRRISTNIENSKANKKTNAPPPVETANIWSWKINVSPQVKMVNILGFQSLGIVSFEHALPDNLKTYIHQQTTIPSHLRKSQKTSALL